ncbi:MAG: hypothetical protein FJX74_10810 [Armatimonadetes bacterium]|nr:hypothetical protein [Armatimonadota bacterium]
MHDTLAILLPALAMGLGWGIRGQFGHESGAMVPGALVGLALAVVGRRELGPDEALRMGAVGALACSLGGVMTYGQTIGLVQGRTRKRTRWWGLLGLAIKGGVWIGLTGAFIGMAAGGRGYGLGEVATLCTGLAGAAWVGVRMLNRPHDPPTRLPRIYFSARDDPRPRPEYWGGLWLALAGLLVYLMVRGDGLAVGLTLFGLVGGGLGFAIGECVQAWGMHQTPFGPRVQRWMDWWKVMEVSFGLLGGAALGLGWLLLEPRFGPAAPPAAPLPWAFEAMLLGLWTAWLVAAELGRGPANRVWEASFVAVALPMALAFGGGLAPAFIVAPVLLLVSGDNVVRQWAVEAKLVRAWVAWTILAVAVPAATNLARHWARASAGEWLLLTAWGQTALTVVWALGTREVFAAGTLLPRVPAARGQVTVQAVFLVMCLLLTALLGWSGR